ncbi:MAG: glycosyltransferase family 9 protein [Endomicrobia bacterium]|nr:glycosyltransferase family 9 protein [Endomicrobiia bacterium]
MIKKTITSFRKYFAKMLFDRSVKSGKKLDMGGVKSILFLRHDNKIGDMAVLTLVFRELKKRYPEIKIYVLCGKDNKEIIKNNPNVDEIIEVSGRFFDDLSVYKMLKNKKIDAAVDFFIFRPRPKHLFMIRRIDPEFLIGFHKQDYNMYDLSINCDINELHISQRYKILLKELGIDASSLDYDVFLDPADEENAKILFNGIKNKLIINPFAASRHRSFDFEKLQDLINKLKEEKDFNIFIICSKKSSHLIKEIGGAALIETSNILESAAYIKYCDYVISPDTSIVHITAAFKKKMISLFLDYSNEEEKINKVWAPGYKDAVEICVDTKNGNFENDINNIGNGSIVNTLKNLLPKEN